MAYSVSVSLRSSIHLCGPPFPAVNLSTQSVSAVESFAMGSRPADLRKRIWNVKPKVTPGIVEQFSGISPVLVNVLFNRGYTTPALMQSFLDRRYLESDDPFLLTDMDRAVERLVRAIENDEQIVVYGDFDADGVTSTVLLTEALRGLGVSYRNARPYIPDRVDEGYGLNKDALTKIKEEFDADVVITVDCGIRSVKEVEHANSIGLDMIVTDHHSLGSKLPPALAVINPKRESSRYPEKMLAGVGIAWKLAEALAQAMPQRATYDMTRLLDLVAIGTVADLAPLLGENRILVERGVRELQSARRPGVAVLAQIARINPGEISAETIAFTIGPRINAAGRLAHAYDAAKLLAAPSRDRARPFAEKLETLNRERQKLTEDLGRLAESMIEPGSPLLMAAGENFEAGVVGLVASRLQDKHYRPAIIVEQGAGESRGSCRSIREFHITKALDEVSDLLVRYGGHAAAAGFTIENKNLPEFQERMTELARKALNGKEPAPTLDVDAEIALSDIDWAMYESLKQLEPTGMENRRPLFMSPNLQVVQHRVVGKDATHLQLELSDGRKSFKGIAFRQAAWATDMPMRVDAVYSVDVNEFRGRRSLQLKVKDLRIAQ